MEPLTLIAYKTQATYRNHETTDALVKYLARYASHVEQRHRLLGLSVPVDLDFASAVEPPGSSVRPAVGLVRTVLENPRSEDVRLLGKDFV